MKYTLKQMSVFDAVASLESVSGAARKLSMTQSAVSMSLQQLENLLGRPLFIRQGNRLILSHWGHWLRPRARKLLADAQQIAMGLHDQHLLSGSLSMGASQTAAEHLLGDLISRLDSDFPQIHIELMVENTENVIAAVQEYEVDFGIIEGRSDDAHLVLEPWLDDHLVVIAAPHHPYGKYGNVSLSQLEQAKWVLREQGAGTRRIFDAAIHGNLDRLNVWREYEQVPVLKALVKNGPYLSALPYLDVERDVAAGQLIILPTPKLNMKRQLSFVWRADATENPLRDCVISEAKRLARHRHTSQEKL
ncbi:LysR substrate-binding domain-containing protein [Shewanella litorisediminis]|uniref:LysR family transcriptional regulator n=1 Tax=Shewanella litorisediminis TaxID=1173586 RepID=A0ABX7G774_9GAMM|nr:LysR substrate-binding domain-containing protein [Shewanella litorisediminis]MCL2919819.1 LysR substrate-binding domain-containing protein [Shewanella litorisediminis]QRH03212.1 LysR family transcriptional regulator [Shewanella litorisediminis]